MHEILTLIDELQSDIFAYQIGQLAGQILCLAESLTALVSDLTAEQIGLNAILKAMVDSYEKKDYLLLADLLEFKLKPLLQTVQ